MAERTPKQWLKPLTFPSQQFMSNRARNNNPVSPRHHNQGKGGVLAAGAMCSHFDGGATTKREETETLATAIKNLLSKNTSFSDVQLVGTDGEVIQAHRTILAARSEVFETLLLGSFSEAHSPQVMLGYDGTVIRAIVEYCYTDSADQLLKSPESCNSASIPTIMNLASASDFFGLPQLGNIVTEYAFTAMQMNHTLAWNFLISEDIGGLCNPGEMWHYAMNVIRNQFAGSLLLQRNQKRTTTEAESDSSIVPQLQQDFLPYLSTGLLETIVADEDIMTEEIMLFQLIYAWVNCDCSGIDNKSEEQFWTRNERAEFASTLVRQYIHLDRIDPEQLNKVVEPTGLVTTELLLEAYKSHTLSTKTQEDQQRQNTGNGNICDVVLHRTSRGPCWATSKSEMFKCISGRYCTELLECREMKDGVHCWSIKVVQQCDSVWLGVATTKCTDENDPLQERTINTLVDVTQWLGKQDCGWVYGSNGSSCHAFGQDRGPYDYSLPVYERGSIVKFKLDLTRQGTLTASVGTSVGQSAEFIVFDNMLIDDEDIDKQLQQPHPELKIMKRSFVPAVSLKAPGKVQFLGFHPASFRTSLGRGRLSANNPS